MMSSGTPKQPETEILIDNLDYNVTEEDLKMLFSEFGSIKKLSINYSISGRSLGSANLIYARHVSAIKAIKTYNGVPLDGRPMKIQVLVRQNPTSNMKERLGIANRNARPINKQARNQQPKQKQHKQKQQSRASGKIQRNGKQGKVQKGKKQQKPKFTAEQLNAELDQYMMQAVPVS